MSKKEDNNDDDLLTEPLRENAPVDEPPKKNKKKKNTDNTELKTLYELVTTSDIDILKLVIQLSDAGYLNQFYDEERKIKHREYVKPTFSVKDFEKIIEGVK